MQIPSSRDYIGAASTDNRISDFPEFLAQAASICVKGSLLGRFYGRNDG
jgi:hypothetical protein